MDRAALSPLLRSFERHLRAGNRSGRWRGATARGCARAEILPGGSCGAAPARAWTALRARGGARQRWCSRQGGGDHRPRGGAGLKLHEAPDLGAVGAEV